MSDITANLPSLQFENTVEACHHRFLYLREHSRGIMLNACSHAVFLCKLLSAIRQKEEHEGSRLPLNLDSKRRRLKVGIIGGGHTGKQLTRALLELSGILAKHIQISTRRPETLQELQSLGVKCFYHNRHLAAWAEVLFLCCLPSQLPSICSEIQAELPESSIVYSLVTAVPVSRLKQLLCHSAILRPEYQYEAGDDSHIWGTSGKITAALRNAAIVQATCPWNPGENENASSDCELSSPMSALILPDSPLPVSDRLQSASAVNSAEDSGKDDVVSDQSSLEKEDVEHDQAVSRKSGSVRKFQLPARKMPGDILMIQSDHTGKVDIVQDAPPLSEDEMNATPPPLAPASTWTSPKIKEFKVKMSLEKNSQMVVRRGEVVTIRVPTNPDGKRLCWEFATDDYDIGFGLYFDWVPVTSTAITIQTSDSSDEEEEDEDGIETHWHVPVGDVERGSKNRLRVRYGEIMPVFRRDSHREVQAGNHDYPGEGIYLLKLDNSYSLLRNKTLYFHVYYTS